jgi:hypothetical protein
VLRTPGCSPVAAPMFGPRIDAAIVVVVAEIPWLARNDRLPAAGTRHQPRINLPRGTLAQDLMLPAITAVSGLSSPRHVPTRRYSGREMVTAAGSRLRCPKKAGSTGHQGRRSPPGARLPSNSSITSSGRSSGSASVATIAIVSSGTCSVNVVLLSEPAATPGSTQLESGVSLKSPRTTTLSSPSVRRRW